MTVAILVFVLLAFLAAVVHLYRRADELGRQWYRQWDNKDSDDDQSTRYRR